MPLFTSGHLPVIAYWLFIVEGPRDGRYEIAVPPTPVAPHGVIFNTGQVLGLAPANGVIQPRRGCYYGVAKGGVDTAILDELILTESEE